MTKESASAAFATFFDFWLALLRCCALRPLLARLPHVLLLWRDREAAMSSGRAELARGVYWHAVL